MPIDEDDYKPIITKVAFNSNCIQYESMRGEGGRDEGKKENLSIEKYLDTIKPYLSVKVNNKKLK